MKSSEPVKLRSSVIANGGSGANQISGWVSSDRVGTGLVGAGCGNVGCGVIDGNGWGTNVTFGVSAGRLQEEVSRKMSKRKARVFNLRLSVDLESLNHCTRKHLVHLREFYTKEFFKKSGVALKFYNDQSFL